MLSLALHTLFRGTNVAVLGTHQPKPAKCLFFLIFYTTWPLHSSFYLFLSVLCKRTHSKSYCETSSFMSTLGVVNQVLLKHKMNSCCDLSTLVHLGYRDSKRATQVQVGYLSSPMQAPCLSFNPSISDQVTSPHPQSPWMIHCQLDLLARGDFYAILKMNMLCRNKNSSGLEATLALLPEQRKKSKKELVNLTVPKIVSPHVHLLLKTGAAWSFLAPGSKLLWSIFQVYFMWQERLWVILLIVKMKINRPCDINLTGVIEG